MNTDAKVLVVGTTTDYIDWIQSKSPGKAVFLTDPDLRRRALEAPPREDEEILCRLEDFPAVLCEVRKHLKNYSLTLEGIVCYDCESMELSAFLADALVLKYPSRQAVINCRNKYLSKNLWRKNGLKTPRAGIVRSRMEVARFMERIQGPCVLKPSCGSGSELVFCCKDPLAGAEAFDLVEKALRKRLDHRLYGPFAGNGNGIMIEEPAQGREYSCDFIIEDKDVRIVRLTGKIPLKDGPFGTTQGYLLPGGGWGAIEIPFLEKTLYRAASSLGVTRALCMVDFMFDGDRVDLLEMAPRPGGDCLPFLLRAGRGLDILELAMDFSRNRQLRWRTPKESKALIGLRLHAKKEGVLKLIDTGRLEQDGRVKQIHITRRPGHRITMPPQDYDSWTMGHVIFEPDAFTEIELQCALVNEMLGMVVE